MSIDARKLDDLLSGPDPTFVKMDIEGAEPYAILGATEHPQSIYRFWLSVHTISASTYGRSQSS